MWGARTIVFGRPPDSLGSIWVMVLRVGITLGSNPALDENPELSKVPLTWEDESESNSGSRSA
jgi:hypothetical protein